MGFKSRKEINRCSSSPMERRPQDLAALGGFYPVNGIMDVAFHIELIRLPAFRNCAYHILCTQQESGQFVLGLDSVLMRISICVSPSSTVAEVALHVSDICVTT